MRTPTLRSSLPGEQFPRNYTHVQSNIDIIVLGRGFNIPGTYFAQENGIDGVCAQACLKMSLIHIGEATGSRLPPTSGQINKLVEENRKTNNDVKFNPLEGLTITDLEAVLIAEDAKPLILDTKRHPLVPPYEWAYLLIESGIPALVAFCVEGDEPEDENGGEPSLFHVMPVAGHTLNGDKWLPMAQIFYEHLDSDINRYIHRYRSTAEWVCHLVIHDDALGPYYCMSKHDLLYPPNKDQERKSRIRYVVGVVPETAGFTESPYAIQQFACLFFWTNWLSFLPKIPEPWRTRFTEKPFTDKTLILRTQLCKRGDYIKHLCDDTDHMGNKAELSSAQKKSLRNMLPGKFWVTEFSLAETYAVNKSAFGEILIKFAPTKANLARIEYPSEGVFLGMRFINTLQAHADSQLSLGFTSHYPLLRREHVTLPYE